MKLEIGKKYECIDILGCVSSYLIYIGQGFIYEKSYNNNYCKKYSQSYGKKLYVFKRQDDDQFGYRYAVAKPLFDGVEWTQSFKVIRYGNDLNHMFVDFNVPYFSLEDEYAIAVENFPLPYSKEIDNSG